MKKKMYVFLVVVIVNFLVLSLVGTISPFENYSKDIKYQNSNDSTFWDAFYDYYSSEIIVADAESKNVYIYSMDKNYVTTFLKAFPVDFDSVDDIICDDVLGDLAEEIIIGNRYYKNIAGGIVEIFDFHGNSLGTFAANFDIMDKIEVGYVEKASPGEDIEKHILIADGDEGLIHVYNVNGQYIRTIGIQPKFTEGANFVVDNVTGDRLDEIIVSDKVSNLIRIYDNTGSPITQMLCIELDSIHEIEVGNVDYDPAKEILVYGEPFDGKIYAFEPDGSKDSDCYDVDYGLSNSCDVEIGFTTLEEGARDKIIIGYGRVSQRYIDIYNWSDTNCFSSIPESYDSIDKIVMGNVSIKIPGFEVVFALMALIIVGFILKRRKNKK